MKVQEHKIVTKRKRHPNDVRYPCRPTHEIIECGRKLIDTLTKNQQKLFLEGNLIIDESDTAELFDSVIEEDIIGLGIHRKFGGFSANTYKVVKIHKDKDFMECENAYSKESEEISFQDFSIGLALNAAEVLYRDDKPFGVSAEQEIVVKIHYDEKDVKKEEVVTESTETSSSNGLLADDLEEEDEDISATSSPTPSTPTEATPPVKREITWSELYYAFGVDQSNMSPYVILNNKAVWDKDKTLSSESEADYLAERLEFDKINASTYDFTKKYAETQLRMLFKAFKMEEKPEMIEYYTA
jgi:hypothetical protein